MFSSCVTGLIYLFDYYLGVHASMGVGVFSICIHVCVYIYGYGLNVVMPLYTAICCFFCLFLVFLRRDISSPSILSHETGM